MTQRARQIRRTFFVALALFISSMLGITAYTLWRLHAEAITIGLEMAALHTRSAEDFLTQNLNVTELAAANALPPGDGTPDPTRIAHSFVTTLQHAPFLRSMSLLDAHERIIASSNPANVGVTVSTQRFLPPTVGQQEILRIGAPWAGRDFADGQASTAQTPVTAEANSFIPVTRTLVLGTRTVTLLVALNPDYFINHISQALDAPQGSVEVLRFDGTLLMDTDAAARAGSVHDYVVRDLGLPEVESGTLEQVHEGHHQALTAFRASRLYPFIVVTHLDRQQALQTWRTEAQTLLGVLVPVLLLISVLSVMFYRRQLQNAVLRDESEQSQRLSATVFDASAQSIIITDLNANIISVNAAFTRISGYCADEVLGRNPRLMTSGLQGKPFYEQLWRDLLQHGAWHGEMINRRRDGSLYDVQVSITASRDARGSLQHFIGVSTEITERKQSEAEALRSVQLLRASTEEAQAANLAKSRFLATMSHEIRTPMNGILGMAQLLLMPNLQASECEDYARTILTSGQSLLTLLNDILDLSKIESGKLQFDSTAFAPEQLVRETEALFSGSAKAKNLQLDCQWRGPLRQRYTSDAHRLRQMLANLVGNALKFTAQGHVRVEAYEMERQGDSALLEFSVSDTGLGIAADKLDLLFKPFSQTDTSTTREFGGSGLGLSIVSSLAKLLGGDVGVESEPGVGSRFWFRIRADIVAVGDNSRHSERPLSAAAPTMPLARLGGHVLVAEDNLVNYRVIKALLTQLGLSITLASDGQQAVDAITQGDVPDIVLMDLHMPVMDGYSATQQIRQWEADNNKARLPIIALTADAFEEDRQRCLAVGMDDFLTKPIAIAALQATLAQWLPPAPAELPASSSPATAIKPVDEERLLALVAEITPLLVQNKFDALACFDQLRALAAGTGLAPEIEEIGTLLKAFQFDLALTRLRSTVGKQSEKNRV